MEIWSALIHGRVVYTDSFTTFPELLGLGTSRVKARVSVRSRIIIRARVSIRARVRVSAWAWIKISDKGRVNFRAKLTAGVRFRVRMRNVFIVKVKARISV